jgi:hypothetical protein
VKKLTPILFEPTLEKKYLGYIFRIYLVDALSNVAQIYDKIIRNNNWRGRERKMSFLLGTSI